MSQQFLLLLVGRDNSASEACNRDSQFLFCPECKLASKLWHTTWCPASCGIMPPTLARCEASDPVSADRRLSIACLVQTLAALGQSLGQISPAVRLRTGGGCPQILRVRCHHRDLTVAIRNYCSKVKQMQHGNAHKDYCLESYFNNT